MKVIIQRVLRSSVSVEGKTISSIARGILVLVGISRDDTEADITFMANKILNLRLFEENGKNWRKSVTEMNFEVLCISQFTLCHKLKGNKLDFHDAMKAEDSQIIYDKLINQLRSKYKAEYVKTGKFGAHMIVDICNDGPVTIELLSQKACLEPDKHVQDKTSNNL